MPAAVVPFRCNAHTKLNRNKMKFERVSVFPLIKTYLYTFVNTFRLSNISQNIEWTPAKSPF